jgi:hypothetical protein
VWNTKTKNLPVRAYVYQGTLLYTLTLAITVSAAPIYASEFMKLRKESWTKMQIQLQCDNCEAEFKIKHNLDEMYYEVMFCPFCGGEIAEEVEDSDEYE